MPRSDLEQPSRDLLPCSQSMAQDSHAEALSRAQQQMQILQQAEAMGMRLQPPPFQPNSQIPYKVTGTPQAALQVKQKKGASRKQPAAGGKTAPKPRKELKRLYEEDHAGICLCTRPDHSCFISGDEARVIWSDLDPLVPQLLVITRNGKQYLMFCLVCTLPIWKITTSFMKC